MIKVIRNTDDIINPHSSYSLMFNFKNFIESININKALENLNIRYKKKKEIYIRYSKKVGKSNIKEKNYPYSKELKRIERIEKAILELGNSYEAQELYFFSYLLNYNLEEEEFREKERIIKLINF